MFPALQVGPLAVQVPGLVMLAGLWLGLILAERYAAGFGVAANQLYNLAFVALASGVIGARVVFVLRYPLAFTASPISLLSLNLDLFDPSGGLALALIASLIYGQRHSMKLLPTLDALTPLLAILAVTASIAHLASGSAFGAPTHIPWGIDLWGERRHPTQVYEILASSLLLIVFWPGRETYHKRDPGNYFLAFTGSSASLYLFLQAFRGDSPVLINGLRIPQIIAWLVLAFCLVAIGKLSKRNIKEYKIR